MSLFNQLIRSSGYDNQCESKSAANIGNMIPKPRTFRETVQDQIAYHKSKIQDLQEVLDSMTPEVEKFVEALQKIN